MTATQISPATQIRPATRLSPLVAGIRTAVASHADWAETAQLVADQLRRHLPTLDVLTAAQRLGSPDGKIAAGDYAAAKAAVAAQVAAQVTVAALVKP